MLSMTQGYVTTLTQGHIFKVKVHTYPKYMSGHSSLLQSLIWIIFRTIVVHNPRLCHDLDLMSYLQGHCHYTIIQTPCPNHNTSLPCYILIILVFITILVHGPRVCHDLDTKTDLQGQGYSAHIPKIRVGPYLLTVGLDLDISHNYCSWPMASNDLDPMSYLQGQVRSAHIPKINVRAFCYVRYGYFTQFFFVHDPRVCHDLGQRSRPQFTFTQNPCMGHNSLLPCWIWINISHNCCP